MKIPLSRLGAYDPFRKTISTAIRTAYVSANAPHYARPTIPAHLRVNPLDGYGTKWVAGQYDATPEKKTVNTSNFNISGIIRAI